MGSFLLSLVKRSGVVWTARSLQSRRRFHNFCNAAACALRGTKLVCMARAAEQPSDKRGTDRSRVLIFI